MTKNAAIELAKEVNELARLVILLESRIAMLEKWEAARRLPKLAEELEQIDKKFAEQIKSFE